MKKSLIAAGASAVAMAAMPMAGVFAADVTSHTDTLNLTISQVCTLGEVSSGVATSDTDETTHANGTGTWTNDTLAATVYAGNEYDNLGTTTFTVRCNDNSGFQLKAVSGTASSSKATLVSGSNLIYSADGSSYDADTSGTSYWNFKLGSASTGITIAEGYDEAAEVPNTTATVVASTAAAGNLDSGQSVTVTYGAGIDNYQAQGTYTGTVVYTLVAR